MDEKITLKAVIENAMKHTPKDLLKIPPTNDDIKSLELLGLTSDEIESVIKATPSRTYLTMTSGHRMPIEMFHKIADEAKKETLQESFTNKDKQAIHKSAKTQALNSKIRQEFSHVKPK